MDHLSNLDILGFNADNLCVRLLRNSPIGPVAIGARVDGLACISIISEEDIPFFSILEGDSESCEWVELAIEQLGVYFSGNLQKFTVPLYLKRLSDFQRMVLQETARIPYGEVRTYGEIAQMINKPNAARAVGGALAHNPIAIMIPCHRVVAHDGRLHGFSSPDGLLTKAKLLSHEGINIRGGKVNFG